LANGTANSSMGEHEALERQARHEANSVNDETNEALLLDRERQLVLTQGLNLQIQFEITSSLSNLKSIQRYFRGLKLWQSDVLYVEIRELLMYDSMEAKWRNLYDDGLSVNLHQQETFAQEHANGQQSNNNNNSTTTTTSSHLQQTSPWQLCSNIFYLGQPQLDEDFNIEIPLHIHYQQHNPSGPAQSQSAQPSAHVNQGTSISPGCYRLELRLFQYGGETASVFLPFTITESSLRQLLHVGPQSNSQQPNSNDTKQYKPVRRIMTTLNSSNNFVHTIQGTRAQDTWTKLHFNRSSHVHFDSSKHSSHSSHHLNANDSTRSHSRQQFPNAVNLPVSTLKKSLQSIASRKFSKSSLSSKKSVILFVIGNGLDESKLPKGRVTVLRPQRIVEPLTPPQMTARENQTRIVQSLLNNAPFCPIIFYDLNNGRTVTTRDIQYALHFVHERARAKRNTSNVIILCTWTFRLHQRLETLDNLFSLVCELPNVLFVSSAGNDGEDLAHSVVYPAICDPVLAVGSLDPLVNSNNAALLSVNNQQNNYHLNPDSNRGDPVNFYVRAESTSDAAIYSSVVLALMWLLEANNGQRELRRLFLREACTFEVCGSTQRRILSLTNSNNAVRRLMGEQEEEQIGGILIESDSSDDESLVEEEMGVAIAEGGVSLESVNNDSDDEETLETGDRQARSVNPVDSSSDDSFTRTRNQYLNSIMKKLRHTTNSMLAEYNASLDVLSSDILDGTKIDAIAKKLLVKGNMNRVLIHGAPTSGKSVRLQRLMVRIAEQHFTDENTPSNSTKSTQQAPLVPFFVSLAGITKHDNVLQFVKDSFTPVQTLLWENSTNRLLIIDDFQESLHADRDIENLTENNEDLKIVISSSCHLLNSQLASTFHEVHVTPPRIGEEQSGSMRQVLFGASNQAHAPLSDAGINHYLVWCKQHAPMLLQNTVCFSSLINTEIYRKLQKMPERKSSGIISKLLQHLSSTSQSYQSVVEDVCLQFIDSLTDRDLEGINFHIADATLTRKKKVLQKVILPVLSLFAFHTLQSSSQTFSRIVDPFDQKKYDFVYETIAQNISKFKLFTAVSSRRRAGNSKSQKSSSLLSTQYRFVDPFFLTILASYYIHSTFSDFKNRKKDTNLFYEEFYRQLHDPHFYNCFLYLRNSDSEFKRFLIARGIDQLLLQHAMTSPLGQSLVPPPDVDEDEENTPVLSRHESSSSLHSQATSLSVVSSSSSRFGTSTTASTQHSDNTLTEEEFNILDSPNSHTSRKRETILKIISISDHFDMYQSEKTVNRLITLLSTEKDSITQQYIIKAMCRLASQCPDSVIQVIVRSIQVIASDPECEIRCFAINQLRHFTSFADLEQMIRFLLDLFRKEMDEQLRFTVLDTINCLAIELKDRKSIWFELWSLDENDEHAGDQSRESASIQVSLLKTMSILVSTPQHFGSVLQRLIQMLSKETISFVDALFMLRELAARTFSIDDVLSIIRIIEKYAHNTELVSSGSYADTDEISVLKLEIIGNLLRMLEILQEQEAQRVDKSQNPFDDSLQESLIQDLFSSLKNGSARTCQKAIEMIEQLPDKFSQRVNILKRTAECVAAGSTGQSVLTKRLIRLFDKFMDEEMASDAFWSCFVKLGYIVSDYDIDRTAHDVILHIAQKRSTKEVRVMLDELVRRLHENQPSESAQSNLDSLRSAIQRFYFYLVQHEHGDRQLSRNLTE